MMDLKNEIIEEPQGIKELFLRFKDRDFKGNTGQAIKNSSYQFATSLITKIGSLLFTIIIARLLLPELFGLYGLSLSIILLFSSFSDFGLGSTLLTYIAKNEKNKPEKAKSYFYILLRWRIIFILFSTLILVSTAYFISYVFYSKPIFLALLAGALYLPSLALLSFIETSFIATNNFKYPLFKEILFQCSRLILVPLAILFALSSGFSQSKILALIILALSLSFLAGLTFLVILAKKKLGFLKHKTISLNPKEKKELLYFTLPLSLTLLSGIFFGYIDILMLGKFVGSEFIGYYQSAFSLATSGAALLSFASVAIFPIFARLSGKSLERGFKKVIKVMVFFSLIGALFTFLIAPIAINLIFGSEYLPAINLLRIFSLIILLLPLIGIYSAYYVSNKRTLSNSIILLISTAVNIILNIIVIYSFLDYGMIYLVAGVCISTVISKIVHLGGLMIFRRR